MIQKISINQVQENKIVTQNTSQTGWQNRDKLWDYATKNVHEKPSVRCFAFHHQKLKNLLVSNYRISETKIHISNASHPNKMNVRANPFKEHLWVAKLNKMIRETQHKCQEIPNHCKTRDQNLIGRQSPPTTMSWYKKTMWPNLQLRTTETSTNQEPATFTPINKRLWKFTFKLKIISKRIRLTFIALIFTQLLRPTIRVSSTNCKWEIHISFDWLTL